jgi:hypothetical protein
MVLLLGLSTVFTACKLEEKIDERVDKITNSLEIIAKSTKTLAEKKDKGFPCDDEDALERLQEMVKHEFGSSFEIDRDNIVIWSQNSVGRYTCKAKVKKVKKKKKKSSSDNDLVYTVLGKMFASDKHGVGKDGGWINYYTYLTTSKKKRVELILPEEKKEH